MHGEQFRADLDDPTVARLGTEVIKHGKSLQVVVPPIHLIALCISSLIDIFPRHFGMLAFVIQRIGADDNLHILVIHGGIAGTFQILVSNAAVLVQNFVVPSGIAFADGHIFKIRPNDHIEIGHDKRVVRHGNPEGFVVSLVDHDPVKHIIRLKPNGIGDFFTHHCRSDRRNDSVVALIAHDINIVVVAVFHYPVFINRINPIRFKIRGTTPARHNHPQFFPTFIKELITIARQNRWNITQHNNILK